MHRRVYALKTVHEGVQHRLVFVHDHYACERSSKRAGHFEFTLAHPVVPVWSILLIPGNQEEIVGMSFNPNQIKCQGLIHKEAGK